MLVAGIDVGAELHHFAVVDEAETVVVKATSFAEDAAGYQKLFELLGRAGARGGGGSCALLYRSSGLGEMPALGAGPFPRVAGFENAGWT